MSLRVLLMILAVMLSSQVTWCTDHDVQCDPDIPSRPRPDSGVQGVAMAHGDDQESECDEGEYLDWFKCSPCEDGTYRTRQMAKEDRYSRCQKCHTPGMYEIVTESCTRTKDAKIMCEDGFYRYEEPGKPCQSHCIRCDICGVGRNMFKNFERGECGGHINTVCCEHDNMELVDGRCVAMTTATTATTPTSQTSTSQRFAELKNMESTESYSTDSVSGSLKQNTTFTFMALVVIIRVAAGL